MGAPVRVSFSWETDDEGRPLGPDLDSFDPESFPIIHGAVGIEIDEGGQTYQLGGFEDVAESADGAFWKLLAMLREAAATGGPARFEPALGAEDFTLEVRNGEAALTVTGYARGSHEARLEHFADRRSFRVPLADYARALVEAAERFGREAAAAFGPPGPRILAAYAAYVAEARRDLAGIL